MIHNDLYNALLTLRGDLPDVQTGPEAWREVRPDKEGAFIRGSFWWVLQRSLPFAQSFDRQRVIAEWIWQMKENSGVWPPIPVVTKPAVLPLPNTLKQV